MGPWCSVFKRLLIIPSIDSTILFILNGASSLFFPSCFRVITVLLFLCFCLSFSLYLSLFSMYLHQYLCLSPSLSVPVFFKFGQCPAVGGNGAVMGQWCLPTSWSRCTAAHTCYGVYIGWSLPSRVTVPQFLSFCLCCSQSFWMFMSVLLSVFLNVSPCCSLSFWMLLSVFLNVSLCSSLVFCLFSVFLSLSISVCHNISVFLLQLSDTPTQSDTPTETNVNLSIFLIWVWGKPNMYNNLLDNLALK